MSKFTKLFIASLIYGHATALHAKHGEESVAGGLHRECVVLLVGLGLEEGPVELVADFVGLDVAAAPVDHAALLLHRALERAVSQVGLGAAGDGQRVRHHRQLVGVLHLGQVPLQVFDGSLPRGGRELLLVALQSRPASN